jgi:hypothetical protein
MWKQYKVKIVLIALAPFSILLIFLASCFPSVTELIYSRGIYRFITSIFTYVFGIFPFSVAEIALYAGILFLLFWIIRRIILAIKKRSFRKIWDMLITIVAVASVLVFLFNVLFSINYYRTPLSVSLNLTKQTPTAPDLAELTSKTIDNINALIPKIYFAKSGESIDKQGFDGMAKKLNDGYKMLQKKNPLFIGARGFPKKILFSVYMTYTYTIGIYSPYTFEPNINYNYPDFLLPMAMAHETAHLMGIARENEAEYVAYLSCINNPDPYYNYSGYMCAYMRLSDSLYGADSELADKITNRLDPKAQAEINYFGVFCSKYQTRVAEISNKVNDTYLKAQGQTKGALSYDDMIKLMLADYLTQKSK